MATVNSRSVTDAAADEAALVALSKKLERYWRKRARGLAEDLAQAGSLQALTKRASWPKRGTTDAYLFKVGLRAGLSLLRKEATQKRGKTRIQQEAERLLYFKQDGIQRRKRRKSDEPNVTF